MAEYIKRTDAVKIAEKYGLANGSVLGRHTGLADCIASEISCLPAANVAPVVHGRWIEKKSAMGRYFECSNCGAHENKHTAIKGYYCWRCGAKMDIQDGGDNSEVD